MTWYLERDTGTVYEHDPEFSGVITTLDAPRGEEWALATDLLPVMRATWEDTASLGNSPVSSVRASCILMDIATRNWVFGTPP